MKKAKTFDDVLESERVSLVKRLLKKHVLTEARENILKDYNEIMGER